MRESSGVEDGADTGVDAACKAAECGGGLDDEGGAGGGIGVSLGQSGGEGGDGAELDVGELLGAVADDLVLDLTNGFELDFAVGGGESVEDQIGGGRRCRHGGGGGEGAATFSFHSTVKKPRRRKTDLLLFFLLFYFLLFHRKKRVCKCQVFNL